MLRGLSLLCLTIFSLAKTLDCITLFSLFNMSIVHRYRVKITRNIEQEIRAWVSQCDKFSHGSFRDQKIRRRAGIKKTEGRVGRRVYISGHGWHVYRESSTYAIRADVLKIRAYFRKERDVPA